MRPLLLSLWLLTGAALAEPLDDARAQVLALDFKAAKKSLAAAGKQPSLSRAQVLELYELEGIVSGTLNDAKGARDAFTRLLNLDPTRKLSGKYAPRVTTPFLEAKGWVVEKGALSLEVTPPVLGDAGGKPLTVKVTGDVFGRVKQVRVEVQEDGAPWRTVEAPGLEASVPVKGKTVAFLISATGEAGWVLAQQGTREEPRVVKAPEQQPPAPPTLPVTASTPRPGDAPLQAPGAKSPVASATVSASALSEDRTARLGGRMAGLVGVGVGACAVVAGGLLWWSNWLYHTDQLQQQAATGRTRQDALALEASFQSIRNLWAATVGLGVAAAVGGTVLLLRSSDAPAPSAPTVAVAPVPGGGLLSVAGPLP